MPIVAGIGGNSGNQTITMIVRALALGQIQASSARKLFAKEIARRAAQRPGLGRHHRRVRVAALRQLALGLVMTAAMTLNLLVAALMGVVIPDRSWRSSAATRRSARAC